MLTKTVRELLNRRKAELNRELKRTKEYNAFVLEKHNEKAQLAARYANLVAHIDKLNKVVDDPTFKFIIWDYGTFYSLQVFEGEEDGTQSVFIGEVNTNWADENNLYIQRPMFRKRFKTLKGIERYIIYYYNNTIQPGKASLTRRNEFDGVNAAYEINFVQMNEVTFKESRAVVFTMEMMVEWKKTGLLPIIRTLYNGKRYNRNVHNKKVIAALKQGKIIEQDKSYIVYWTL